VTKNCVVKRGTLTSVSGKVSMALPEVFLLGGRILVGEVLRYTGKTFWRQRTCTRSKFWKTRGKPSRYEAVEAGPCICFHNLETKWYNW